VGKSIGAWSWLLLYVELKLRMRRAIPSLRHTLSLNGALLNTGVSLLRFITSELK
jgi:hypothetical protein